MSAAVIKVKFADPAKDGKKQATIKTEDGQIFGVWPDKFGLLRPGRTYQIEFSERAYQGKTYRTITKCVPAAEVEDRPNDAGTDPRRSSPSGELEFVTRLLAASLACGGTVHSVDAITQTARMLRQVYRETFTSVA